MGDSRHPLNIPITADPVIGNQKPHNMKKLLIFLAVIALTLSCEKENNPKSQITVLDKLVETAASTNDDGSYNLEMTMSGGGYTVKLSVPNPDMKLKAGSYEVKTGGCSVSFNSGYVERKVSGGTIDIASDNNAYTIDMTVISRNEEFIFKFHGQIEFKSFVGTVIRNRSVNSAQMKREMKYSIYLPKDYGTGESFPVLYLLHGYGDENNAWLDKGNLFYTAREYEKNGGNPMIVVMPDGLTDFYQGRWENYMYDELMPEVETKYKFNGKRAVAGLSMGGYGSLYYWCKYSDMYCYAYAMSPAVDVNGTARLLVGKDKSTLPPLTIETGIQDQTTSLTSITEFHDYLVTEEIEHEFITRDGSHDWTFWQVCLPKALDKCGKACE